MITSWWRGYSTTLDKIDMAMLVPLTCDYCGHTEPIYYPKKWGDIEYICEACDGHGDMFP